MYKLTTRLTHFRFNTFHNYGPLTVTWYKLIEDNDDIEGVCLTKQELNDLTNYVANNQVNFQNPNYSSCDKDEAPAYGLYDLLPSTSSHPRNLIIRKIPQMPTQGGQIYPCMDIELLDINGTRNHSYNLDFDIIGQIEI